MNYWRPYKRILERICDEHDVTLLDLKSGSRLPEFVLARSEACWLAKSLTDMSLSNIGHGLGGRDHATVTNLINKAQAKVDNDPEYRLRMGELKSQLEVKIRGTGSRHQLVDGQPVLQPEECKDPLGLARRILGRNASKNPLTTNELELLARRVLAADEELRHARGLATQMSGLLKQFGEMPAAKVG